MTTETEEHEKVAFHGPNAPRKEAQDPNTQTRKGTAIFWAAQTLTREITITFTDNRDASAPSMAFSHSQSFTLTISDF